jgi:hypothetical protein
MVDCRFPIADCRLKHRLEFYSFGLICHLQFKNKSAIGNQQSAMFLVRFLSVIRSSFDSTRHLGLAFFFLVRFLAGIDCGSHSVGLTACCFASRLNDFASPFGSL